MKKRILGLALALVMIISLLPLTASAAGVGEFKIYLNGTNNYIDARWSTQTAYFVLVDDTSTTENTTDKVFKKVDTATEETPTTAYIKVVLKKSGDKALANVEINAIDTTNLNQKGCLLKIDAYGLACDTTVTLVGDSIFCSYEDGLGFNNAGTVTIDGTGSLTITGQDASHDAISKYAAGDMTINNVTITVNMPETTTSGQRQCLTVNGNLIVNNATLTLNAAQGASIRTASARSSGLTAKDVTFNNSTIILSQKGSQNPLVQNSTGIVTINNSNVELIGQTNNSQVLKTAPTIVGTYSSQKYSVWQPGNADYSEKNYTAAAFDSSVRWLKLVHEHVAAVDDHDCTTGDVCACGYAMGAGSTAHAGVVTDCTKDTMCTNPGCQQVYAAKLGDAHVAGQDDGDCTTAVKCQNCEQNAVAAQASHKDTRTDCSVAGTCANTGCQHAFTAGQHSGGTATCKAKAKCAICSKEYGELAACTPAADDGDCTTDIKCSVCQKVTTKGQDAHKYTDKNDTTCDNAGCTKTRTVEGTENPKTGDATALVLVATLMVAAAAAFVTSKKFVR